MRLPVGVVDSCAVKSITNVVCVCVLICCVSKLSGSVFFDFFFCFYSFLSLENSQSPSPSLSFIYGTLWLYPSSAFAQLLFNCSRLTGNSSARQTDRQSAKRSRLLLLSPPWVCRACLSLSLSLCNAIFVASLHSSSSHCA